MKQLLKFILPLFSYSLQLPCLDMLAKWRVSVDLFVADLKFVQAEYNAKKHSPPLNRNLPPLVGKIAWSRQLFHRINKPVQGFQSSKRVLDLPETRKALKGFNKLAQVRNPLKKERKYY